MMKASNILANLPAPAPEEFVESLARSNNVRVERIASHGHTSPEGFWYDQESNEWVMVVQGSALLQFKDDKGEVLLRPGDHVFLPAHVQHRVAWTDAHTIWVAVHWPQ
jgi:cupin 2 domain-containing protein